VEKEDVYGFHCEEGVKGEGAITKGIPKRRKTIKN